MIPTHNTRDIVLVAVESALRQRPAPLEIIVVDDHSTDGTGAAVKERFPWVHVLLNPENVGFAASANRGLALARGGILVLLNSDAELLDDSLEPVCSAFRSDPTLAVAGAELLYPDRSPQWSGGGFPYPAWLFALTSGIAVQAARIPGYRRLKRPGGMDDGSVEWVTGAALAMKQQVWVELGPLDEGYGFYAQDMDFCRRAVDAGSTVRILPGFRAIHHLGATIATTPGAAGSAHPDLLWSDLLRFVAIHDGLMAARRSRRLMLAGAWLRLTARRALLPLVDPVRRRSFEDQTTAYQKAAASLWNSTPENMIASAKPRI